MIGPARSISTLIDFWRIATSVDANIDAFDGNAMDVRRVAKWVGGIDGRAVSRLHTDNTSALDMNRNADHESYR